MLPKNESPLKFLVNRQSLTAASFGVTVESLRTDFSAPWTLAIMRPSARTVLTSQRFVGPMVVAGRSATRRYSGTISAEMLPQVKAIRISALVKILYH